MIKDKDDHLHLVYGTGDSIMYAVSLDNGMSFSSPALISVLPHVYSFAMRGPQIAATNAGIIVRASTSSGNIFSFRKMNDRKWMPAGKINVTHSLNEAVGAANWSVNTQNPQKILTISSDRLPEAEVIKAVEKAGFKAEKVL